MWIKLKCPTVHMEKASVDSRSTEDGSSIRRRRECLKCNRRYTTYEKIETTPILVIKKNMSREYFDRNKIVNGLMKACQKRPVSRKQIEQIADEVERHISNEMLTEVNTDEIGQIIMKNLKKIDEVSYVRFASVYRQFKDINTFMEEIKNLMEKN